MEIRFIGMIAAMPEEIRPLLKRAGVYSREKTDGFDGYRFILGSREIRLIRSGMGVNNAAAATRALVATAKPDLIINFGFAGAVTSGLNVGDIVIAERLLLHGERSFMETAGIDAVKTEELARRLDGIFRGKEFQIRKGTFITSAGIKSKLDMAELLPSGVTNPVLEMETAAVARASGEGEIPLIAIRAISDGSEEELKFTMEEFTGQEMNIRLWKVLLAVVKKPWIVPQLLRLAKNSRLAGDNLAAVLVILLELVRE
jgi:adenosylhomocysteine nucleosidase